MYNPLDHIATTKTEQQGESELTSTSAWENDRPGYCPKCQSPFGTGTAGNGDTVFFCEGCCLTHPMPNS